jgi:hypothetical protein
MSTKYFSVVLFLVGLLALSSCYGDTNIITNPGFEDSNGWGSRGCTFTYTTAQKHSGANCGKASDRTATWQGIKQSLLGKMENGKTYQISGWVRLENAISENIIVSIEQKDGQDTKYHNVASQSATDSNWVQLSGSFTLNVTGTLEVLDIYFEGPPIGTNFYVDDVNVSGPPAAPPPAAPAKPFDPNAKSKVNTSINRHIINLGTSQNIIKECQKTP